MTLESTPELIAKGRFLNRNPGQRTFRDLLLEGVVVVLSILTAFGLDAWWDSHREGQDLQLDLTSVLEEVVTTHATVIDRVESYDKIVVGTEALLETMDRGGNAPSVLVSDTIVYLASLLPTLNPRMSALADFISSGRLAAVSDREPWAALGGLLGLSAIDRAGPSGAGPG